MARNISFADCTREEFIQHFRDVQKRRDEIASGNEYGKYQEKFLNFKEQEIEKLKTLFEVKFNESIENYL